jgi:hypothetical protein
MFETVPTAGLTDQVTAVFDDPLTVAVNWLDWDADRDFVEGVTETLTGGMTVTLALADAARLATLVAVTVTVCELDTVAGAV